MPDTLRSGPAGHLQNLRRQMAKMQLDAFILPRFDAHQGEYVAPHDERLQHVTGFSGSAGMAVITGQAAALFVDGRYQVQARQESPMPPFSLQHIFETPPETWLADQLVAGWRVGCDAMHLSPEWYQRFQSVCEAAGATLVPVDQNPVDLIWADQPAPPRAPVWQLPTQMTGRSRAEKTSDLMAQMQAMQANLLVETQPDNIAWLLNLRGGDVAFLPVVQSFLLADAAGQLTWFVDQRKLSPEQVADLSAQVRIREPEMFLADLDAQLRPGLRVLVDPSFSPAAVTLCLQAARAEILSHPSLLALAKARKSAAELEGMRACHILDGVAWTEFVAWLHQTVPARCRGGTSVSEREAEARIHSLRQAQDGFLGNSFNPISAAGGNAAMCHYATTEARNAPIRSDQPYLLDSGGQYETGTTDATRSFAFGPVSADYTRAYTAVFKAFHALATLRFPPGTQGHHIDAICRRPLWDLGLDYDHGTGHGVGHCLSVHEHPQRIGKPYNPVDLHPGMVLSIEPGHYVPDRYGIRIENLFEIVAAADGFLEFANLTYIPIQTEMLDTAALSHKERAWLNNYHAQVKARLSPHLSNLARGFLADIPQV